MAARTSTPRTAAFAPGARMMRSLCLSALLVLCGCFSPDQPECSFRCDDTVVNGHHCPDNYTCQLDVGYCRLNGSSARCGFDLAVTPSPDDMSSTGDLSSHD